MKNSYIQIRLEEDIKKNFQKLAKKKNRTVSAYITYLIIEELTKGELKMKTTYYFVKTNAYNEIIATDGKRAYSCPYSSSGKDINSEINIYAAHPEEEEAFEAMINKLKTAYEELSLYNMDEIEQDYPNSIFELDKNAYEVMIEIITIE